MSRLVSGVLALLLLAGGLVLVASGEQSSAVTGNIEWVEMSAGAGDLPVPLGGSEQTALLVGDIDGDGDDDIAMGSRGGTNSVVWFRRTGSTWEQSVVDAAALRPEAGGALHDVDGDGLLDIVLAGDFMSNEIWWWKNPGATAFGSAWTRYTAKNSGANKHHDIAFGDFDNDGSDEFAYWNQGNGNTVNDLFIAEIPADPTTSSSWPAQVVVDATTFSEGLAVGDVDADGDDDLVGGGRIISYNSTTSSYDVTTVNLAEASYRWHIADIVQGGRPELITASGDNPGGLGYYEWDGATWVYTTLLTHELAGTWSEGHSVDTGDVDGDGFIDVFAAEMAINAGAAARSVVFYGDGAGSFVRDLVSTGIDNHESKLADIDDDGDLDIVSKPFNQGTPELRLFANPFPGHDVGSWQRHLVGTNTLKQAWVRHGDIDLDGDLDLLAGRAWFENPGSLGGSWTRHVLPSPMLHAFLLVDVDGDGDLDVFGEQGLNSMTYVWSENDGSGSFTSRSNIQNIVTATNEFHQGVTFVETPTGVEIYTLWNDRALGIEKITVPADPINTTWPTVLTSLPSQGEEAAFVDIDGDGDLDFIQGHMWSRREANGSYTDFVLHNPTTCCFAGQPVLGDRLPDRMVPADINLDGRIDIVVSHEYDPQNSVVWYEQPLDPTTEWPEHLMFEGAFPIHSLDVADIDGDGDQDAVIGEHGPTEADGTVYVLQNMSGTGSAWKPIPVHTNEENHDGTKLADLDGDGDLDIYSIGWLHFRVIIHENLSGLISPPVWHDVDRRYRTNFEVGPLGVASVDHPAVAGVDFTAALGAAGGGGSIDTASLKVVEVDGSGAIVNVDVPFQFDPSATFDASTDATGELVVLMPGNTAAGQTRYFQVYFEVTSAGLAPTVVAPLVTTTPGVVDAGVSTTRVETPAGDWFFDMAGGGFASLDDADGNDWIGYSTAVGAAGEFRGIPNLIAPADGGHFHPGSTSASSSVVNEGPLRTTIRSSIPGTGWAMSWQIYPGWATATVDSVDGSYWFQYEGTPGGTFEAADQIHESGGTTVGALATFGADLAAPEWMAAADSTISRSLVMAHHDDDTIADSYRDQDDLMTVAAFGRPLNVLAPSLTGVAERFSVGLVAGNAAADASSGAARFTADGSALVTGWSSRAGGSGSEGGWTGQPAECATCLLRVTTNPPLPSRLIVDGLPRDRWGLNWMKVTPGQHEVCFGDVVGWVTPPCQVVDVQPGVTGVVDGVFQQMGSLRVITEAGAGGGGVQSTISVNGNPANDWGSWTDVAPGNYEVCFGNVPGFAPEPCQNVVVVAGVATVVTGTFDAGTSTAPPQHGFLRVVTEAGAGGGGVPTTITINGNVADSWGLNWLKLAPGAYEVCFSEVVDLVTPTCNNVTITAGVTTIVNATFDLKGWLRILTAPAQPSTLYVDGVAVNEWGYWSDLPVGDYRICFGEAAGFAPACQTVSVAASTLTTVTGNWP